MPFILTVLQDSTVYPSWWVDVRLWSWIKILINSGEQVIGCPILDSTLVWSSHSLFPHWLMVSGKVQFVCHLKLLSVPSAVSACHVG